MEQVYAQVSIRNIFPPAQVFSDWGTLVTVIVRNAFVLAGVTSFVLLILGGFGVIVGAGGGDSKQLEQAKKTITAAIGGLLIVVTSLLIMQLVEVVTGLKLLGN